MQIYNRQAEFVALRELNVLTYLVPWRKLAFLNRNTAGRNLLTERGMKCQK